MSENKAVEMHAGCSQPDYLASYYILKAILLKKREYQSVVSNTDQPSLLECIILAECYKLDSEMSKLIPLSLM